MCLDEEEDFDSEESDEEGGGKDKKSGSAKKARMSVCDTFIFRLKIFSFLFFRMKQTVRITNSSCCCFFFFFFEVHGLFFQF